MSELQDKIDRLRSADFSMAYVWPDDVVSGYIPSRKVTSEYYAGHRTTVVDDGGHPDYGIAFVDFGKVAADDEGCEQCSTVVRSNFRILLKENKFHEPDLGRPLFVRVGYGRTDCLGAFVQDLDDDMINMLVGLVESYPALDDSDLSEMEHEEITASWREYLQSDLYNEMGRIHRHNGAMQVIWDRLGEKVVERLFWDAVREEKFGSMIPIHDGKDVIWGDEDNMVKIFREILIRAYWDRRKGCSLCGSDSDECMQGCRHQGEAVNG